MAASRNGGLTLALAGIALLTAAAFAAYRPPAPLGTNAPLAEFSAYRAKSLLNDLVGNGVPHPIGSSADAKLRDAIVERLTALGYTVKLQTGWVCNEGVCGNPVNIVATRGSLPEDADAVVLAAHYDSVPAGPGASDDGVGVAALLEIARILAAQPPPRHPLILLLTDGEEAGLLGALLFVRDHPLSKQVRAAVNMEARGTSGLSLMFETGAANAWLMRLYAAAIARPITNSLYYVVYKLLPNDTDFSVFKAAAYQGYNFAFIGNVGRYHTPLDDAANASASSIQHQGDNAWAATQALANSATLRPPKGESVFFDVFARALIAWPAPLTLPAALLTLALLSAEALILLRARAVTPRELLWGGTGILCTLVFAATLCAGLLAGLIALGKVPPLRAASWIAQPLPMHIAAAALSLLAAAGLSAKLARRAGFWGFWVAAALLEALLTVACAAVPGASFAFLLGAIAAALGGLPSILTAVRYRGPARLAADFAALLPALVIFGSLFPLLRFLYMALGNIAWPISTLALGLVAVNLMPLLTVASRLARRLVIVTAAAAVAVGAAVTLHLPTYSAEWPERINVEYWFDADSGRSHYFVHCDSLRLPAPLAAAAHFDPVAHPRFSGSELLGFHAPAPTISLAAPELTPIAAAPAARGDGSRRHFELHLRSVRGAPEALMIFPARAQIAEVEMASAAGPVHAKLRRISGGATLLDIVGLPAAGVDFGFDAEGRVPVDVQVFDESYASEEGRPLERARPSTATSSQDGDVTVVHRTVSLSPAAGR